MSLDLDLLPDGGVGWLDASGPEGDIVLSTRVRLARNLAGASFTTRTTPAAAEGVLSRVRAAASESRVLADAICYRLEELDRVDRILLHERHLVSKELAGLDPRPGVRPGAALVTSGLIGVMVNEEDHLRMQAMASGFQLPAAWRDLAGLERALGDKLPFAFHPEFGYLTACPTNAGTGLRASVLIHLPGLVLTKEINRVLQGLGAVGLTFRGLYGEGSEIVGNFFQLSNQTTLGKSEDELLDALAAMVRQVIGWERDAREVLARQAPTVIADKVWRAYGTLRYARRLAFEETMNLLSAIRLGAGLNLVSGLSVYVLNKLLVFTQPAHLARATGRALTDPDLPVARATFVRELLTD